MSQSLDSSRSSTPGSEDIDMEYDAVPALNQPQSPVSPQNSKTTSGFSTLAPPPPPPGAALVQGTSQAAGGSLPSSKQSQPQTGKKRTGHSKGDPTGHGEGSGVGRAGALMDPAQGSAYDRLLDLTYPRDYGDPALRYDMANGPSPYAPIKIDKAS